MRWIMLTRFIVIKYVLKTIQNKFTYNLILYAMLAWLCELFHYFNYK